MYIVVSEFDGRPGAGTVGSPVGREGVDFVR